LARCALKPIFVFVDNLDQQARNLNDQGRC